MKRCKKCGRKAENRQGVIVCMRCGDNQDKCRCDWKHDKLLNKGADEE